MDEYLIKGATLTGIANAIRTKEGSSGGIDAKDFEGRILGIETGKDVSGVTATADDVLAGKKFVDSSGAEITGTLTPIPVLSGTAAPDASLGEDGAIYLVTE